jgi:hypothetical protein
MLFNVEMKNNIVAVEDLLDPDNYPSFFESICTSCIQWEIGDTLFLNMDKYDFHLDTMSVAEMKAIPLPGFDDDLDAHARDVVNPDIGCYEFPD